MKENGFIHKRRTPHTITKATTEIQEKDNIIKRDFKTDKPLTKLLTDITQIQCSDGKLYVSPVLDCYNGEIVALEIRENMKKELCVDTIKQLGKLKNSILHSYSGSQYTSTEFRKELNQLGIIQSLSSTGRCYDNSRMENFFATLKKEKIYRIPTYKMTRKQVKRIIFRYIFCYYNTQRITSFNPDGMTPIAYLKLACESLA